MMNSIKRFVREEEGVTMVEYGLLAALIAVVCIAAIKIIGVELDKVFDLIGTELQNAQTPPAGG
jgi:pilus assembly protein Flp/PilA